MRFNHVVTAFAIVACSLITSSTFSQPVGERCCFPDATCENLPIQDCGASGGIDFPGTCQEQACTLPSGTCVNTDTECCLLGGGTSLGPETTCTRIPTISEWGIASLGLLLLAGLPIKFGAFRKAA